MAHEHTQTPLGRHIQEARIAAGHNNQAEFARQIGVTPTTLWRYERGDITPGVDVLLRIARLTGRTVEWLCAEAA